MIIPAVSVIIPLYNAEKYVGELLNSILAQTFQNFEVIVVDDCSTDNSVAVVQNFMPLFGERLTLTKTKKNSGGCAIPRNKGLPLSRGEYISFLDADDTITPTALGELYSVAKQFDADVVACEKYFNVPEKFWYDAEFRKQLQPFSYQNAGFGFVNEPTLLSDNVLERVQRFQLTGFLWNVWSKLIRRDFIFKNELPFVNTIIEDVIFTGCLACTAPRYVHVPNVVNYYREMEGSISHMTDTGVDYFRKYFKNLTTAFRDFDRFLTDKEIFHRHVDLKYMALEKVWLEINNYLLKIYNQFPAHELDEILREEFSVDDNVVLAAFAFNIANVHRMQLNQAQQQINNLNQFAAQAQARIAELENEVKQLKARSESNGISENVRTGNEEIHHPNDI